MESARMAMQTGRVASLLKEDPRTIRRWATTFRDYLTEPVADGGRRSFYERDVRFLRRVQWMLRDEQMTTDQVLTLLAEEKQAGIAVDLSDRNELEFGDSPLAERSGLTTLDAFAEDEGQASLDLEDRQEGWTVSAQESGDAFSREMDETDWTLGANPRSQEEDDVARLAAEVMGELESVSPRRLRVGSRSVLDGRRLQPWKMRIAQLQSKVDALESAHSDLLARWERWLIYYERMQKQLDASRTVSEPLAVDVDREIAAALDRSTLHDFGSVVVQSTSRAEDGNGADVSPLPPRSAMRGKRGDAGHRSLFGWLSTMLRSSL